MAGDSFILPYGGLFSPRAVGKKKETAEAVSFLLALKRVLIRTPFSCR